MYFWNIEQLKKDIKTGRLHEKDRFIYAIIYIVIGSVITEAIIHAPTVSLNIWDTLHSIGNTLIIAVGTYLAYKANGGVMAPIF